MSRMHNPPHPGEVIRELCLDPLKLTVTAAAEGLGVSRSMQMDLSALPRHRAGGRLDQSRDDRRKCGLTCPVLSQQSDDLALINIQLNTGKDLVCVETFRDSTD